ncbi:MULTISPECIES: DUF6074 family protein [unclassified Mesorhizobium]|nr:MULTISPECIES: DUF6074 family protein [unclassified Mesorhizobium]RUY21767.1 hypothetical protein EN984_20735 [Mesorhizobium sp. M7A.F.Ca.CA.004.12.1.1]RVA16776.1 hypothetical protein EN939_12675 [Mesorhizobium sp. M7A.F.Ca.CA.002.05.1.1]RVC30444.1 hypothetical protein EN893_12530 [Mesorhizobium sp. M7A.F.Ca.CA.004.04.2.1]
MGLVICFPMARRLGKIKRTAELLSARRGRSADHYWRQTVAGVVGQLTRAGMTEAAIRKEVQTFSDAVQEELRRAARRNEGDAA